MRTFDAKRDGLRIDPLDGGTLAIEIFIRIPLTVKRVTQARPDARWHDGGAPAFLPAGVANRAPLSRALWKKQRAHIFAALASDQTRSAIREREFQGHPKAGRTDEQTFVGTFPRVDR